MKDSSFINPTIYPSNQNLHKTITHTTPTKHKGIESNEIGEVKSNMNNKPNYKKGYRKEILKNVFVGGANPYANMNLISEEEKKVQRCARIMQEEGVVRIEKTSVGKRVVVSPDYKYQKEDLLEIIPESYIAEYEEQKDEIRKGAFKGEETRAERIMSRTAVMMFMNRSEIKVYPDEKEPLKDRIELTGEEDTLYATSELKKEEEYATVDGSLAKKKRNSRVRGLVVTQGGMYAVYTINRSKKEWWQFGESKAKHMIERILRSKGNMNECEMILLTKDYSLVNDVLKIAYYSEMQLKFMTIIDVYEHIYALPLDNDGIKLMKLMKQKGWKEKIIKDMFGDQDMDIEKAPASKILCDSISKDGTYNLLFCIPDIKRLRKFAKKAMLNEDEERFAVYCFTFQKEVVEEIIGGYATVYTVDINEYLK